MGKMRAAYRDHCYYCAREIANNFKGWQECRRVPPRPVWDRAARKHRVQLISTGPEDDCMHKTAAIHQAKHREKQRQKQTNASDPDGRVGKTDRAAPAPDVIPAGCKRSAIAPQKQSALATDGTRIHAMHFANMLCMRGALSQRGKEK